MPDLVIVRHGNTFDPGEQVLRVGGRTDLALSASGRRQSELLAEALARRQFRFAKVWSSPLRRTLETALALRNACAPDAEIEPLEALREIDYGPDEGQPEEAVIARIGEAALQRWETDAAPPPGWIVAPEAQVAGWRELFSAVKTLDGPALAVTSNGVARFAIDAAEAPPATPRKLKTGAFGIVRIGIDGDARILEWNTVR